MTRPIIFSAAMVRAILEGRKTQTRRPTKRQPQPGGGVGLHPVIPYKTSLGSWTWVLKGTGMGDGTSGIYCPYGQPGGLLWVREKHWRYGKWVKNGVTPTGRQKWRFVATRGHNESTNPEEYIRFDAPERKPASRTELGFHPRPSLFHERAFARITLEVTGVRVERVQEISEADAEAEGITDDEALVGQISNLFRTAFAYLWSTIHAADGPHGWTANPWVWVIEFRRAA